MVCVGIDVAKDKHDCFILDSEGETLADVFTVPNTMEGFRCLLERIRSVTSPQDKIRVGLEATGHYSYNLLGFLLDSDLATYVLNPLKNAVGTKGLLLPLLACCSLPFTRLSRRLNLTTLSFTEKQKYCQLLVRLRWSKLFISLRGKDT